MSNPKSGEWVTIREVAQEAGVSISTVSLVVGNSPKVAAKTRRKVLAAIDRLKYIPNEHAAALRRTRKDVFAAILPDLANPFYLAIMRSLRERCTQAGIILHVSETFQDFEIEKSELLFLDRLHPSGYAFLATQYDDELIAGLKTDRIVMIDKIYGYENKYPQITIDNTRYMRRAATYLLGCGCRSITYLTRPVQTQALAEKRDTFLAVGQEAGFDWSDRVVEIRCPTGMMIENGHLAMIGVLARAKVDGVIATSDLFAVGAMRAVLAKGMSIPDDVCFIGFENTELGRFYTPSLTTFDPPAQRMGELAYDLLTRQLDSGIGRLSLGADMIIRESVR